MDLGGEGQRSTSFRKTGRKIVERGGVRWQDEFPALHIKAGYVCSSSGGEERASSHDPKTISERVGGSSSGKRKKRFYLGRGSGCLSQNEREFSVS